MNKKDFVIKMIESGPLFKHMERDYSIFFLSSIGDAHTKSNIKKYGDNALSIGFMLFTNLVSMYYRLENDNEIYLKNIADNIQRDPKIKEEIFRNYSEAGEEMKRIYAEIESRETFDRSFIMNLASTLNKLITYQVTILHRADSFVKNFEKTPGVSDEIMTIRKKYESVFGQFETMYEKMARKTMNQIPSSTFLDFKYLTASELSDAIETKKLPTAVIAERKKLAVMNFLPTPEVLTGERAEAIYSAVRANEAKYHPVEVADNQILGKTVFGTGKIIGKCRVITDYNQIEHFQDGILVTPSTLPKYNHIYQRAKAIVTNEGGILAHAAILCREFKIPGIIGTKIATQAIKDGDELELDLDKGIVKILK
jgi:phosphohistidine swiveling domain-containing protein